MVFGKEEEVEDRKKKKVKKDSLSLAPDLIGF
jgi:hypothetical protein